LVREEPRCGATSDFDDVGAFSRELPGADQTIRLGTNLTDAVTLPPRPPHGRPEGRACQTI